MSFLNFLKQLKKPIVDEVLHCLQTSKIITFTTMYIKVVRQTLIQFTEEWKRSNLSELRQHCKLSQKINVKKDNVMDTLLENYIMNIVCDDL